MNRLLVVLSLAIGAWMLSPTPQADARGRHHGDNNWSSGWGGSWTSGGSGFAAPELDPGEAGSAIVLLLGGLAYFGSRRRKESLV